MERTAPNATLSSAIHDPTFHRRHPPVFRRGRRCRTSRPRRSLVSRCEVRATVSSPTPPVVQVRTVPTGHVSITRDSRQFSFLRSWCTSLGSVRLSAPTHRVTYDRGRRIRKIRSVSSGSLEHATQRTEAQPGPIRTSPPAAPRRRDGCGTRGGGEKETKGVLDDTRTTRRSLLLQNTVRFVPKAQRTVLPPFGTRFRCRNRPRWMLRRRWRNSDTSNLRVCGWRVPCGVVRGQPTVVFDMCATTRGGGSETHA